MVKPFSWRRRWPDTVSRVEARHSENATPPLPEGWIGDAIFGELTPPKCCGQGCSRCLKANMARALDVTPLEVTGEDLRDLDAFD